MRADVDWQPSLFDGGPPALDISYRSLQRIELDEHSWVDYCPGWLAGSDDVITGRHQPTDQAHRDLSVGSSDRDDHT